METQTTRKVGDRSLVTWLFNPFHYVAGGSALVLGLVAMMAAGWIGWLSDSHFDGALDFHTGVHLPPWVSLSMVVADWAVLSLVLLVAGKLVSTGRFRAIDVFGTQALARIPTIVMALSALPPGFARFVARLTHTAGLSKVPVETHPTDAAVFAIGSLIILAALVWMVALMYKAFSISCNTRGGKAIAAFIASLIIAEIATKLVCVALFSV